ncbi:MAG: hypothetical protein ACLFTK_06885 [Anaerolineales bacterium]
MRIGWITADYPKRPARYAVWWGPAALVTMRYRNIALGLNRLGFRNEFYRPDRQYDAVIVIKAFHEAILDEVKRLRARGTRVIFDANVNYYYIWGRYPDARTQPTSAMRRAALNMTCLADDVIADSQYLLHVVRDYNPRAVWIPDNVWPVLYPPSKTRRSPERLRLIWSGVAFKAGEFALIQEALARVKGLELWLVSDKPPAIMAELQKALPLRWFRYQDFYYAWLLGRADVIVSPRELDNAYNLGHTEYKITLGMSRNLPALASPQPSYCQAINYAGGGIICQTIADWVAALEMLRDDPPTRAQMGQRARHTVEQRYATPVVVQQYAALLGGGWGRVAGDTRHLHD